MKDIKVIKYFVDKYNPSVGFQVGTVVTFEDERANNVVSRGLAEFVEKEKDEKPAEQPKDEKPADEQPKDFKKPAPAPAPKAEDAEKPTGKKLFTKK